MQRCNQCYFKKLYRNLELLLCRGKKPIKNSRAVIRRCFAKKIFSKNSRNSQENTLLLTLFLLKLQTNFLRTPFSIVHFQWLLLKIKSRMIHMVSIRNYIFPNSNCSFWLLYIRFSITLKNNADKPQNVFIFNYRFLTL